MGNGRSPHAVGTDFSGLPEAEAADAEITTSRTRSPGSATAMAIDTSSQFAATQHFGRFRSKADVD